MIWKGNGTIVLEEDEPALRSCWECNTAHEHLKTVNFLHQCFDCGKWWVFDIVLSDFTTDEELDTAMQAKGLEIGDSTTKIDAGYRITVIGPFGVEEKEAAR